MTNVKSINDDKLMEKIVSLCKRKGFVFQGSEIYGGLAGVFDFGPNGVELLNNLKRAWWKANVYDLDSRYGLDSGMFKHPKVWDASGHTSGFSDPLAECRECNTRIRVDKELGKIGVLADEKMTDVMINKLFEDNRNKIACPKCGKHNFTQAKAFNLLVKSNLGDFTSENVSPVYLPGEACQGIYLDYKNIIDSMSPKMPFGIVQIGKAFRNEISPRNFLFRTRELEQADTQIFIKPNQNKVAFEKLKQDRLNWYISIGIKTENLRFKQHDNLVFYASDACDIEYNFPGLGFDELEGVHDRTDYDLTQHMKHSGVDLRYTDGETGEKYIPWILETSVGMGRMFLAVISDAYNEEDVSQAQDGSDIRTVLKLHKNIAPIKICISPLLKNKENLQSKARELYSEIKTTFIKYNIGQVMYDDNGNVGKRYRRQDEIGTPYCITVDFDTVDSSSAQFDTVTVRDRDTMTQERIKIAELKNYLLAKFDF
jgi:glycyl-tRNA synthetase